MPIVSYQTEDPNGNAASYTDQEAMQHLAGAGYDVKGVSSDGLNVTLGNQWAQGKNEPPTITLPIKSTLEQSGYKVKGIEPLHSDREAIDPWTSAKLQKIEPTLHEPYIRSVLKDQYGMENPTVIGSGNNYHVFNPETGTWHQLTEEPSWNKTGALSALLAAPHLAGMGVGGAIGGTAGTAAGMGAASVPMALAGTAVGAGAGSMLGESLTQKALRYLDDDYDRTLAEHPSEEASGILKTGAIDAASSAGAGMVGRGLKALGGRALADEASNAMQVPGGFLSKLGQGVGGAMEGIGNGARWLGGKIAGNDLAANIATDFGPAGGINTAAEMAMAPSAMIRGAAKVAANLPDNRYLAPLVGQDAAESIGSYGRELLAPTAPRSLAEQGTEAAKTIGRAMGAPSKDIGYGSTRDVLHNFVNRLSNAGPAAEEFMANPANQAMLEEQANADRMMAEQFGITGDDSAKLVQEGRDALKRDAVNRVLQKTGESPNWGTKLGGGLENLERAAGGVRSGLIGATKGAARLGQGAGALMQGTGYVLKNAANVASPLELPMELQYGLPRVTNWWEDRKKKR